MVRERIMHHCDVLAVGTYEAVRVSGEASHTAPQTIIFNIRDDAIGGSGHWADRIAKGRL